MVFDLVDADKFDWRSARYVDAKLGREKAIGLLCNTIVVIIFKRLGSEALSVIGLRPASRRERKDYGAR